MWGKAAIWGPFGNAAISLFDHWSMFLCLPGKLIWYDYSAPDRRVEYCDDHVCLCEFVCDYVCGTTRPVFSTFHLCITYGRRSVLLWWRSGMLRTSGFVDDVIFAHTLICCSTSPPGLGSHVHSHRLAV